MSKYVKLSPFSAVLLIIGFYFLFTKSTVWNLLFGLPIYAYTDFWPVLFAFIGLGVLILVWLIVSAIRKCAYQPWIAGTLLLLVLGMVPFYVWEFMGHNMG